MFIIGLVLKYNYYSKLQQVYLIKEGELLQMNI